MTGLGAWRLRTLARLVARRYGAGQRAAEDVERMARGFAAEGAGAGAREAVEVASVLVFRLYGQEPRRG